MLERGGGGIRRRRKDGPVAPTAATATTGLTVPAAGTCADMDMVMWAVS